LEKYFPTKGDCGSTCFRIVFPQRHVDGQILSAISVAVPTSINSEGKPIVYEIALIGSCDRVTYISSLEYDDVARFDTQERVKEEIDRILSFEDGVDDFL